MRYFSEYSSPIGKLTLASSGETLSGLWIEGQKYFGGMEAEALTPGFDLPIFARTASWLDRYFAGEQPAVSELPLAPSGGAFRQKVWRLLCEIPYGGIATYRGIAQKLATSSRAVGGAVGRNPISIIIPCHRVLGADGSLRGYAGGLEKKDWLLKHEGAAWICEYRF